MPQSRLLDILLPSRCAICEKPGPNLCQGCEEVLTPNPHQFVRGRVRGRAATRYSPNLSKLLVAFKDNGQSALARQLSQLMKPLILELADLQQTLYLVPAPSRQQNFAKRGYVPSVLLARELARQVSNARVLNCLKLNAEVLDQVGLTSDERQRNLAGTMVSNQHLKGKVVFLVDDVVTTGATIQEAWRALTLTEALVAGALVVSEARQDAVSAI